MIILIFFALYIIVLVSHTVRIKNKCKIANVEIIMYKLFLECFEVCPMNCTKKINIFSS